MSKLCADYRSDVTEEERRSLKWIEANAWVEESREDIEKFVKHHLVSGFHGSLFRYDGKDTAMIVLRMLLGNFYDAAQYKQRVAMSYKEKANV